MQTSVETCSWQPIPGGLDPLETDLDAVLRGHVRALLARATVLTRGQSDAWDLVQDTLERALRRGVADIHPARLRGWLLVVMHHLYLDRCRAARRATLVAMTEDALASIPDLAEDDPPWTELEQSDVRACLRRLDPRLRDAYALHADEGLPLATVAQRLGVPLATAGTRVYRARQKLRALLSEMTSP